MPQLMKDKLGLESIDQISQALRVCLINFDQQQFINQSLNGLNELELKQRVDHLITVLADYLPADFAEAAKVLISIKDYWLSLPSINNWGAFTAWPLVDYVAIYGLNQPKLALKVLKTLTPLFSAEFAIRPFIERYYDITYQQLILWTSDTDERVRRLASEGSRPRLPWAKRLSRFCHNPEPLFLILEQLKDDPSLYVRRSVANNLNDIAKDNPDRVISLCRSWLLDAPVERQWLIRHALRSLVKSGHQDVFVLLGYTKNPHVKLSSFTLSQTSLVLGDFLEMAVTLQSKISDTQKLVIDYKLHHVKANGLTTSKVFKWRNISLDEQQVIVVTKRHSFKKITTRQYYSGIHTIELLINGTSYASADFELRLV